MQKKRPYAAEDVALCIVRRFDELGLGIELDNGKLQRLLYFVQAWALYKSKGKEPLFRDELEAPVTGPEAPGVRRAYSGFGSLCIPWPPRLRPDEERIAAEALSKKDLEEIVHPVIDHFARASSGELADLARAQRPWRNAFRPGLSLVIPKRAIAEYFLEESRTQPLDRQDAESPCSALAAAGALLDACADRGFAIDGKKLQHLLYLAQGRMLSKTGGESPFFSDPIEAWDSGPAVPSVYRECSWYGASAVPPGAFGGAVSESRKAAAAEVAEEFGGMDAQALHAMICGQKPWQEARGRGFGTILTNGAIHAFFMNQDEGAGMAPR